MKFCHKKGFLLVNLFTTSFNWSYQEADICGKNFSSASFTSLNMFLIFHFKHVLTEARRKDVMENVFYMDTGFKAQLCLQAASLNTNLMYKFKYGSNPNHLGGIRLFHCHKATKIWTPFSLVNPLLWMFKTLHQPLPLSLPPLPTPYQNNS